jgi:5-methylthioadenosine/S-adenosylhomocysteine deaminase
MYRNGPNKSFRASLGGVSLLIFVMAARPALTSAQSFDPTRGIILHGTVVTMDSSGTILNNGYVLVRNHKILAMWNGLTVPRGTPVGNAIQVNLGSNSLIFPGLINLHNHPTYDVLDPWPPPSSDVQSSLGRPLGTEPYANRYQWNDIFNTSPAEYRRLVDSPQLLLTSSSGLGLVSEVVKYSQIKAIFGGETSFQDGLPDPATDNLIVRNVESLNFGRQRIESRVPAIANLTGSDLSSLLNRMQSGQIDAWLVHLSEGVRDSERRPGDITSSRAEFATLSSKGLLTDETVVVQGNGLEEQDFTAMRAAPSIRTDGIGDGLGAKLVWSPLSNLLLYGQTALVYQAIKEGLVVSLGTDWSPSGSRNLLDELKIADIALRDSRLLGADRVLISGLSITGKTGAARRAAEVALDELMVQMVTINPAKTVRWNDQVGSIETGKTADLLVITIPDGRPPRGLPDSPYRDLIDATEEDVRLVLVDGEPRSGDLDLMATLKPGDYETVLSQGGCFRKAVDVTNSSFPKGTETFSYLKHTLSTALTALGGDNPPTGGGPASNSNTYSYLKAHIPGAGALTNAQFWNELAFFVGFASNGGLNIEAIQLSPVLIEDDHFYFHYLGGDVSKINGLIADAQPPFGLYLANFNQIQLLGNPFAAEEYRDLYFELCGREDEQLDGTNSHLQFP